MVLQLVGCGRVGHCQPFPLVSGPGDADLFVGWCFPVFSFGGGGVDPSGLAPPPPFLCLCVVLLCVWCGVVGVVVEAAPNFCV